MFTCKKCSQQLYIQAAEIKDKILKMDVQCVNGHRSVRRLAAHQAQEMAPDLFKKLFMCTDCASSMTQLSTIPHHSQIESTFLCPIHGPVKREFPVQFQSIVEILGADVDSLGSILDSFKCLACGQVYAVSGIRNRSGFLEMLVRCSNGHKAVRYVPDNAEEELLKQLLQRVVHCDRCGLPSTITRIEVNRDTAKIQVSCPLHGSDRKEIPADLVDLMKQAASEIPEDAVVRAMLVSSDCHFPLTIRSIEGDESGYKFRCICPSDGHTTTRNIPLTWSNPVIDRVATALFSCNECGLLTHGHEVKRRKKSVEFRVVCPIHGVMQRDVPPDVFDHIKERESMIDRLPSIVRSLSCEKCNMPLFLRDVEDKRGLIEFDVECRNGHRAKRFFVPGLPQETLVNLYKHFYQCPECYDSLDLVYAEQRGRESRVVQLCPVHGKYVLEIPHDHAEAMKIAYDEIQADKLKPPIEAEEYEEPHILEPLSEMVEAPQADVQVLRGCNIVGGKFDYKVKVKNNSGYVITNVTVNIVAYPKDSMELAGAAVKTISRIEVGGFRSPQFTFYPTKDCVQGKVVATVSFIDFRDQLHTVQVEPYLIRSVCDLLKPSKKTSAEFDLILKSLTLTQQEQTLDWNPQVLFTKAEKILPAKNFHIIDSEETIVGGQFIGTIRGFAKGKYTGKKVAVIFLITGPENGRHSVVKVEALGEDIAMLPTTIDELADTMDSWICLRCGAPLETEQVEELGTRKPIRCRYCSHSLTIALYLQ